MSHQRICIDLSHVGIVQYIAIVAENLKYLQQNDLLICCIYLFFIFLHFVAEIKTKKIVAELRIKKALVV